jgi:aromatic ring-opening dioxygenase LigB subunit
LGGASAPKLPSSRSSARRHRAAVGLLGRAFELHMPLVGGVILPHGALILDPSRTEMSESLSAATKRLHDACNEAAAAIEELQPELILLYTPHGLIADGADMHIYTNGSASGSCEWMGSWAEHRVAVACHTEAAESLVAALKEGGSSVAALCAFSGYDAPLRWGEAVPLSFLRRLTARPGTSTGARIVILSHGPSSTRTRCAVARERMAATTVCGEQIGAWAAARSERTLLLISGDLAHSHGNARAPRMRDGTADPRYLNTSYPHAHPDAAAFEAAIIRWIVEHDAPSLTATALDLLPHALCCG